MLLAVLDLAEAGALEKNEIRYLPNLLERYAAYFDVVHTVSAIANESGVAHGESKRRVIYAATST